MDTDVLSNDPGIREKLLEYDRIYGSDSESVQEDYKSNDNDNIIWLKESGSGIDDNYLSETLAEDDDDEQLALCRMYSSENDYKHKGGEGDDNSPVCCPKRCNKVLPEDEVSKFRDTFSQLSKKDQTFVILGNLDCTRESKSLTPIYNSLRKKYGKRAEKEKSRLLTLYMFRGVPICVKFYLFLHNLGSSQYKAIVQHFDNNGVSEKTHGHCGKQPNRHNVMTESKTEIIRTFIKNYAKQYGIPLPGCLPNFRDMKMIKLPSTDSKPLVYRCFCTAEDKPFEISLKTFCEIWRKYCPYIITHMKPADNLCDICQENSLLLGKNFNKGAQEQVSRLENFLQHLQHAKAQRNFYKQCCKEIYPSTLVLCFDFAQSIGYPSSPQQSGSAYFKSLRKCRIFGIFNANTKTQHNFLIEESHDCGKGPNSTVSMLDHYLEKIAPRKNNLILFADNCVVQNKNDTLIYYLQNRIRLNLNQGIELHFLMTGHTKFAPDGMFGLLKMQHSKTNIDCYNDLVLSVENSTPSGQNRVIKDTDFEFKKWDEYLATFNKPIEGISCYHHFAFEKNVILCRQFVGSDDEKFHVMISEPPANSFPEPIIAKGLSLERQWYLFKMVRDLCSDPKKQDLVAPKPFEELKTKEGQDEVRETECNVETTTKQKRATKKQKVLTAEATEIPETLNKKMKK